MNIIKIIALFSSLISYDYSSNLKTQQSLEYQHKLRSLYWFDASTHAYILYGESTFCDNSNSFPCSLGYYNVSDPSNPTKPNSIPDQIETGGIQ